MLLARRRFHLKLEQYLAIVSFLLVLTTPALAQRRQPNEVMWRQSIEADVRNGAPREDICINAMSSATASDDASFKNWAYSVVRKYCPEQLRTGDSPPSGGTQSTPMVDSAKGSSKPCILSQAQIVDGSRGKRVAVMGSNCFIQMN